MKLSIYRFIACLMILLLSTYSYATKENQLSFQISGVSGDIQNNIEARLITERNELGPQPSDAAVNDFYVRSNKMIVDSIQPFGYFNPIIRSKLHRDKNQWIFVYDIKLKKPVRIKRISISVSGEGETNPAILNYISHFPLKRKDIFDTIAYQNAKNTFFDVVNNEGYIKATLSTNKVIIDPKSHTVDIIWHMDTNARYYFGKISFNKTSFSEHFLQRFDIFHHAPFSSNRLIQYQQEMNDSAYFDSAIVVPNLENTQDNFVPIDISVIPPKARVYNFGVGYGTFTGPRFTSSVKFNRITNTGDSFDLKLKLSSVLSGVAAQYAMPGRNPLTETWKITSSYQDFRPKNGHSNSADLALAYLLKKDHWNYQAGLNYLIERYYIVPSVDDTPSRTNEVLYPSVSATYLKMDDILRPTNGKSLTLSLNGSSKNFLSSTSFSQAEIKGKYLISPFSFSQLIFRGDIGYTVVHNLNDLPLTLRYFAGGPNSIRGFPESSIGPGRYLAVGSAEYRNQLYGNLWGAAFYDFGKATNHFDTSINKGVGGGLIYQSILGPIKLYIGRAISKPTKPYSVEFVMGPEF